MISFGDYLREKREKLQETDKSYSQRQVSLRIGIEPSYLSKIERGQPVALSEEKIIALAQDLGEDPDYLLALGGKISADIQEIIKTRPKLFCRLVREIKDLPDEVIEADAEFKQIHSNLQRVQTLASIGTFQLGATRDQSYWSSHVPGILGVDKDAAPDINTVIQALEPRQRDTFSSQEQEAYLSRTPFQCELRLAPSDNEPRFIQIWEDFDTAPDGSVLRLGILQDVTEFVRLREEMREAKESLAQTVQQQSEKVTAGIDQLKTEIDSRKKLEAELRKVHHETLEKSDIQKTFFKEQAYRLRSQVNRLLTERGSTLKGPNAAGVNIRRISSTINTLSDFFELDAGLKAELEDFNIHELLSDAIAEFAADFKTKNLELTLSVSPNLPSHVRSDRRRIEQVTTSLLELFLHNTDWGNVQVTGNRNRAGEFILTLASTSTKKSMSEEYLYPGLGIKGRRYRFTASQMVGPIIEMFGGAISIKNVEDIGLSVIARIPVNKAAEPPSPNETDKTEPTLVVEDDKYSMLYIRRALQKEGYEVVCATTGEQALDLARAQPFGSILLDIQLPDIDGIQVARSIRGNGDTPNKRTPIIAVTAHATPDDRTTYAKAGIDSFIAKPFKIEALLRVMSEVQRRQESN